MRTEWIVTGTCTRCGHAQDFRIPAFAGAAAHMPDERILCEKCSNEVLVWAPRDQRAAVLLS